MIDIKNINDLTVGCYNKKLYAILLKIKIINLIILLKKDC